MLCLADLAQRGLGLSPYLIDLLGGELIARLADLLDGDLVAHHLTDLLGGELVARLAGLLGGGLVIRLTSQTYSEGTWLVNGLERGLRASPWVPLSWVPDTHQWLGSPLLMASTMSPTPMGGRTEEPPSISLILNRTTVLEPLEKEELHREERQCQQVLSPSTTSPTSMLDKKVYHVHHSVRLGFITIIIDV